MAGHAVKFVAILPTFDVNSCQQFAAMKHSTFVSLSTTHTEEGGSLLARK